jgi:uncharacterized protein (UPF0335 family)
VTIAGTRRITFAITLKKESKMGTNNQIKALVERIEKLEEEKAAIAEDIKEVYFEAKSSGFDTKIIKKIISLRKQDAKKRAEEQALLSVYMDALGMLADTPLGKAAVASAQLRSSEAAALARETDKPKVEFDEDDDDFE